MTLGGDSGQAITHGRPRLLARFGAPNRAVALLMLVIAVCLIPWIILLGFTLPPRYDAGHWPLLWIGYDVAEVAVLAFAAWAAWFRRQILAGTALVVAVLLFVDAWFDIVTSWGHSDQWVTLATGLGAEIPLALFFLWLYRTLILRSLAAFHEAAHDGIVTTRIVDSPFVFRIEDVGSAAVGASHRAPPGGSSEETTGPGNSVCRGNDKR